MRNLIYIIVDGIRLDFQRILECWNNYAYNDPYSVEPPIKESLYNFVIMSYNEYICSRV